MTPEHAIQNAILLACGHGNTTLFRCNTGLGWAGKSVRRGDGSVLVHDARPLHAGLCTGSSDLIGWRSVEITQEMVGRRIGVFVALEVKSATGRTTVEQRRFIDAVRAAGGIADVVRSVDDAAAALSCAGRC